MTKSVLIIAIGLLLGSCGAGVKRPSGPHADKILRVSGNRIVDGTETAVRLRGVSFGNRVWDNVAVPDQHHDETDYRRIAEMGMNTIRFYLNYLTFERDDAPGEYKPEGWAWLDKNVEWARKHGIYLVLNMHVPPGGYQSGNKGKALWDDSAMQERLINLWRAIAERYREEPVIAGYDLLNEPVVSKSKKQWHELAARMIPEVREVDPYHIIFIERVNAVDGDWKEDEERNFFLVDDPNIVYEFHFYKPFHFTHQNAAWVEFAAKATTYPDPDRVGVEWFLTNVETGTADSPKLAAGDSDWTYYEGAPFKVSDPKLVLGRPALVCRNNSGKAYFDDLILEKLNDDGTAEAKLWEHNPSTDRGWYFWTADGEGNYAYDWNGHGDKSALIIERTAADANLSADIYMFKTEQGTTYRLSGWMKGEKIPETAECTIRLDFLSAEVEVQSWDKAFLAQELDAYLAFGRKHNVPLFLGEWGTIRDSFKDGRGGLKWVEDMLALIEENELHFTYHDYHETSFGLYLGNSGLPSADNANQPLIDLFKAKLTQTKQGARTDDASRHGL